MKATPTDAILAEAHAAKDAISAEFNHDVGALCRHLRQLDAAAGREPVAPQQPRVRHGLSQRKRKPLTRVLA